MSSNDLSADKLAIRQVVEKWIMRRGSADWERFATVCRPDAWMTATWFWGSARGGIKASREGLDQGVNIIHFPGNGPVRFPEIGRFRKSK